LLCFVGYLTLTTYHPQVKRYRRENRKHSTARERERERESEEKRALLLEEEKQQQQQQHQTLITQQRAVSKEHRHQPALEAVSLAL
jgi:hypothetical protein